MNLDENFLCVLRSVALLCLTLCNSMDCGPPGSFIHGIIQARILEWVGEEFLKKLLTIYAILTSLVNKYKY